MSQSFLPKHKADLESVADLDAFSNRQLEPYLKDLLTWLKDYNWPVAEPISRRLSKCGSEIVEPLNSILRSDDAIWKGWVISEVVEHLSREAREGVMSEIVRLINSPSEADEREEAHLVAKDIMFLHSHGA
ncbi:MAG: DUF5071 domain-containing protein [Bacteroidota bacterium]